MGGAATLVGCQARPGTAEPPLPQEVEPYVLDAVPVDVANRTLIDFENKVQLVAYQLEPEGVVEEGAKVTLSLYWQPLERLDANGEEGAWTVFTDLLGARGRPYPDGRLPAQGTLRRALPPARWRPGKIYLDQAEMTLPDPLWGPEVEFAVGFEQQWDYPVRPESGAGGAGPGDAEPADGAEEAEVETTELPMRLQVVSGPTDGQGRGIVARRQTNFDPEVARKKAAAKRAAERDAAARQAGRRPPPGAGPHGGRRPPPRGMPGRPSPHGAPGMPGRPSPHGAPGMPGRPSPHGAPGMPGRPPVGAQPPQPRGGAAPPPRPAPPPPAAPAPARPPSPPPAQP
jgi:hypothetical protein